MATITDTISFSYSTALVSSGLLPTGASSQQITSQDINVSARQSFDSRWSVPDGTTVGEIDAVFAYANIQSCLLVSDQPITLKTNNSGSPDNTITLAANIPVLFVSGGFGTNPFTHNVTKIYVANASGVTANLTIRVLFDS